MVDVAATITNMIKGHEYDTESADIIFAEEPIDWTVMNIKMTVDKTGTQHPSWIYTPLYTKDVIALSNPLPTEMEETVVEQKTIEIVEETSEAVVEAEASDEEIPLVTPVIEATVEEAPAEAEVKVAAEEAPAEEVAAEEAPAEEVAAEEAPAEEVATEEAPAEEVAAEEAPAEEVTAEEAPAGEVAAEEVAAEEVAPEEASAEEVNAEEVAAEEVAAEEVAAEEVAAEEIELDETDCAAEIATDETIVRANLIPKTEYETITLCAEFDVELGEWNVNESFRLIFDPLGKIRPRVEFLVGEEQAEEVAPSEEPAPVIPEPNVVEVAPPVIPEPDYPVEVEAEPAEATLELADEPEATVVPAAIVEATAETEAPAEPAEPAEETPEPVEPAEETLEPVEPAEETPEPVEPAEVTPEPAESAEVIPEPEAPTEPAEETPETSELDETSSEPAEPAELTPEPAEPAEVTPEPAEPAEVTPEPAEPAPETPKPAVILGQVIIEGEKLSPPPIMTNATFVLPDITQFGRDLGGFIKDELIDIHMLQIMSVNGGINWWGDIKGCCKVFPLWTLRNEASLMNAVNFVVSGFLNQTQAIQIGFLDMFSNPLVAKTIRKRWTYELWLKHTTMNKPVCTPEELEKRWENAVSHGSLVDYLNKATQIEGHTIQNKPLLVEPIHIYLLSNLLCRPIIILSEAGDREASKNTSVNSLTGIYLPLEQNPDLCYDYPIILGYHRYHFSALVSTDVRMNTLSSVQSPVCVPITNAYLSLLPVHFITYPGAEWQPVEIMDPLNVPEVAEEEKIELLTQYLNLVKVRFSKQTYDPPTGEEIEPNLSENEEQRYNYLTAVKINSVKKPYDYREMVKNYAKGAKNRNKSMKKDKVKCKSNGCKSMPSSQLGGVCVPCYQRALLNSVIETK